LSRRSVRVLRTAFDLTFITLITLAFAQQTGAFLGFPKGGDVQNHLTFMRFVVENWPHIDWFPYRDAGFPTFALYPPQPYVIWEAVVRLTGLAPETSLNLLSIASFILLELGVYGFVYNLTLDHNSALLAPLLIVASPVYWTLWLAYGLISRVMSIMFFGGMLFFLSRFFLEKERNRRICYLLVILSSALSLSAHLLQGVLTAVFLIFTILALRKPLLDKARLLIQIGFPSFLLSAYFYLPFLANRPATGYGNPSMAALPLDRLWRIDTLSSPAPLLIPLFLALLIVAFIYRYKGPAHSFYEGLVYADAVLKALCFCLLLMSIYIFGGNLPFYPPNLYLKGVYPELLMFFVTIFSSLACAILVGKIAIKLAPFPRLALLSTMLTTAGFFVALAATPVRNMVNDRSDPQTWNSISRKVLVLPAVERRYRFGTDSAETAIWFNYEYTIPQTRGYGAVRIPYPHWQAWFTSTVWAEGGNYPETNFLLDWYAVKWFLVGEPHFNHQKFLTKPEFYTLARADEVRKAYLLEYRKPSPILSTTGVHDLLVTSNKHNYEVLLRDLSLVNYNSQRVIPLRGKEHIDDYALDELSKFDLVILYGFDYRDQEKAFNLLADYVREGGGLIVEANSSPFDDSPSIPEPIPVSHTTATNYGTEWNFTRAEHEILEGIDLSAFGPAIYDGGPWGVSSAEEADIRDWAQPILFTNGHPIIVAGQYGQGRVVWTGMNLPYHTLSYRNQEESRFLAQMIEWVAGEGGPQPGYEAHFIHPQRRVVKVLSPAKGVLFKESFFPNWHAYVEGRDLKIYRAGPDFMYVALPKDTPYPVEVILEYKKSNLEWISLGISLVTLLGLAAYAIRH